MNFSFPKNIFFDGRILRQEGPNGGTLIDISLPHQNLISIDNIEYYFTYLNLKNPKSKGGNSIILKLYEADNFDTDELNYEEPDKIIKILKYRLDENKGYTRIQERFLVEIKALEKCKASLLQSVVEIYESGKCNLSTARGRKRFLDKYMYYTMEPADKDLTVFLQENSDLELASRVSLCSSLAKGLKELYELGYYHRDLKPDNILIFGEKWKIADLGLVDHRDLNFDIDFSNELIGPKGWLSPEAINKRLCGDTDLRFKHDCVIDHQSDLFQLGKIFCLILQGNNPMGIINLSDFQIKDNNLKHLVLKMLYYKKKKRINNIQAVINKIQPIEERILY